MLFQLWAVISLVCDCQMTKKKNTPALHNPVAQDLHTSGLYRPKMIENKKKKEIRKIKHKKTDE